MPDPADPPYETPFTAEANGPNVIVSGVDAVAVEMTPEAVLGSLRALYEASADAIKNRQAGVAAPGDAERGERGA